MNKRWILILSCCLIAGFLFAENFWDNHIPEKKENQTYSVFGENVNIRQNPDLKSKVEFVLQPGNSVTVIEKKNTLLEQSGVKEYWYKIKYQNKTGYIWGGLLADATFHTGGKTILVRSLGVKNSKMEIRILENEKILAKTQWESGPVDANRNFEIKVFNPQLFQNPPILLFAINYFVFSEIETGYDYFQLFTLTQDKVLKNQFGWNPASCDPPSCGETTILFPGEKLKADPKIKRKDYQAAKNTVLLISHSYDIDNPETHEFFNNQYVWDGKDFKAQE